MTKRNEMIDWAKRIIANNLGKGGRGYGIDTVLNYGRKDSKVTADEMADILETLQEWETAIVETAHDTTLSDCLSSIDAFLMKYGDILGYSRDDIGGLRLPLIHILQKTPFSDTVEIKVDGFTVRVNRNAFGRMLEAAHWGYDRNYMSDSYREDCKGLDDDDETGRHYCASETGHRLQRILDRLLGNGFDPTNPQQPDNIEIIFG